MIGLELVCLLFLEWLFVFLHLQVVEKSSFLEGTNLEELYSAFQRYAQVMGQCSAFIFEMVLMDVSCTVKKQPILLYMRRLWFIPKLRNIMVNWAEFDSFFGFLWQ